MTTATFPRQPGDPDGDPDGDPQTDPYWAELFDAFDALRVAAMFGDDPDEGAKVEDGLNAAEMVRFGFDSRSPVAQALTLLTDDMRRKAAGVTP